MAKARSQRIPKRVFMTARFPISAVLKSHFSELYSSNPDYDFHLYDDNQVRDYISAHWGAFLLGIYDSIGVEYFPAKIDLWRYLIIYHKGGVYFDDKSGPVKTLSSLIKPNDKMIISTWGENIMHWKKDYGHRKGEFTNWCVIAESRHPMVRCIIVDMIDRIINYNGVEFGKTGVLKLTGPIGSTTTILENLPKLKNEIRVLKNTFGRKMYFNAITKSKKFSSTHESMREKDRLYSIQKSPIVNLDKVKALVSEFRIDQGRSLESVIFQIPDNLPRF